MKLEQKSQQFAAEVHKGQLKKDGLTSYIQHPAEVVRLLKDIGTKEEDILCAAWLHDVIEDSRVARDKLEKEFNPNISRIVSALTRDVNRKKYLDRIKKADYSVQIIKLADVIHNSSTPFHGIKQEAVDRMVNDCDKLYLELAMKIEPRFYKKLTENLEPWKNNFL